MPIFDIFSKRQKKLQGEMPDVYIYDDLPYPLRVQIVQVWEAIIGNQMQYLYDARGAGNAYNSIVNTLRHEYGVFSLHSKNKVVLQNL